MSADPLWKPDPKRVRAAQMTAFIKEVERRWDLPIADYAALHRFSIEQKERFWRTLWDFVGVIGEGSLDPVVVDGASMPGARWFPNARLSFVENLLAGRHADNEVADAIVFRDEAGARRRLSWGELRRQVYRVGSALIEVGVRPGDRVAGYVANTPEAMVAMLGALAVGAVWSSCSPDFGVAGVLDRLGQIDPRVLFAVDGYCYGGRRYPIADKVRQVVAELPAVRQLVMLPNLRPDSAKTALRGAITFEELLRRGSPDPFDLPRLPFDHPLYILYSSGTTGRPKGIVHGAGGVLLQHLKEHRLHCDVRPGDRVFYYTTCGWMMCNWLASALGTGATLLLYEGSPFHPHPAALFDYADEDKMTLLGISAKYLDTLRRAGVSPRGSHRLSSLRTITSTGSPLLPEGFDYVYEHIKSDVQLSSISGGTDIVSCFVLGNPIAPVRRGEIQCRGLGMAVEVFDDEGRPRTSGVGELVCTAPFPSMPLRFWNDPDGTRYRAAYFERFPGVWHHGDLAELTPHQGVIIRGRSDALLKPGGVRIGTAEIYQEVATIEGIQDSLAIGQEWQGDLRIVLFVVLDEDKRLDDGLAERIRATLRERRSPFHVPALVLQVPDLPRTRNGKLSEVAVREVVHGRPVRNLEALANPEVLEHFRDRPELRQQR